MRLKQDRRYGRIGCLGWIVLSFIGVVVWVMINAPQRADQPTQFVPCQVVPPSPFKVGQLVVLARPGGAGHAHVTTDINAFHQLKKALKGGKLGDFTRLREDGKVLIAINGTIAKVLDSTDDFCHVQLEDGQFAGRIGWIETQYVEAAQ